MKIQQIKFERHLRLSTGNRLRVTFWNNFCFVQRSIKKGSTKKKSTAFNFSFVVTVASIRFRSVQKVPFSSPQPSQDVQSSFTSPTQRKSQLDSASGHNLRFIKNKQYFFDTDRFYYQILMSLDGFSRAHSPLYAASKNLEKKYQRKFYDGFCGGDFFDKYILLREKNDFAL